MYFVFKCIAQPACLIVEKYDANKFLIMAGTTELMKPMRDVTVQ